MRLQKHIDKKGLFLPFLLFVAEHNCAEGSSYKRISFVLNQRTAVATGISVLVLGEKVCCALRALPGEHPKNSDQPSRASAVMTS